MNLVEACGYEQHASPCRYGNIVDGHACYCHHVSPHAPRKCPIWMQHGEDATKWQAAGWDDGGCPYFCKVSTRVPCICTSCPPCCLSTPAREQIACTKQRAREPSLQPKEKASK